MLLYFNNNYTLVGYNTNKCPFFKHISVCIIKIKLGFITASVEQKEELISLLRLKDTPFRELNNYYNTRHIVTTATRKGKRCS
jgi:hypothetical protein